MIPERKLSNSSSVSSPLRSEGYNTYSPSIRCKSIEDSDLYIAGQGLVPVVNNPGLHSSNSGSFGILSWSSAAVDKAWSEGSLLPMSTSRREIVHSDFTEYLQRLGLPINKYLQRRMSLKQKDARKLSASDPDGYGYLRGEGLVQALRLVPSLYFQEDFTLTRPDTFSQVIRGETSEERNSTLDTLNGYLDIVETELLNEISARSESFFEAAESLQDLQKSMGDTLFQIQRLHVHAHNLDGGMCARAGQIKKLSRQRQNLKETMKLLQVIESATHAQEAVNLLLLAHDYPSCLQLIADLRQQYENRSKDGLGSEEMGRILCLKHIPDALDASVVSLNSCLVGELIEVLSWDESESILRVVAAKALGEENRVSTFVTIPESQTLMKCQKKKEKLKQIFIGLSKTGSLTGVFSQVVPHIVSRLNSLIRNLTEILLPNFVHIATNDETLQDSGSAGHLQLITHDMFLTLLKSCLAVEESCICYYTQLSEMIIQAIDDPCLIHHISTLERGKIDLCQALVDACQTHWIELFTARVQVHHKLNIEQILELKDLNQKCGELASKAHVKPSQRLESLLQVQSKFILNNIHHQNFHDLQQTLEKENWILSPVPKSFQKEVQEIFYQLPASSDDEPAPEETQDALCLVSGNFHVVNCALCVVSMLSRYLRHNRSFPEFVTEIGRQAIELLSLFNTRSCQLILGAQAMRVSSLKSITAKHLALCSQSILLLLHLQQPFIEALLHGLPDAKRTILQPEFDRIRQDLGTHLEGIHSKLVGIMEDRLNSGVQQMKELFNSLKSDTTSDGVHEEEDALTLNPSQSAQVIAKQLRILTQVLTPLLHEKQLHEIFNRVVSTFVRVLGTVFKDLAIELQLMNPEDQSIMTPVVTQDEFHPLEGNQPESEEELAKLSRQRKQISADCKFLTETLGKLPMGDSADTVLKQLVQISEVLLLNQN
eukprot:g1110.t1